MERADNFSEDSMLADALSKLEVLEKENAKLRQGGEVDNDGSLEVQQLKVQNKELMKVNHQWDLEFRDLETNFQQYRTDSQQAQAESKLAIAELKEDKERILKDFNCVNQENLELKTRLAAAEQELRYTVGGGAGGNVSRSVVGGANSVGDVPYAMVSHSKVKELEEECVVLRQQLKTYQDDYTDERKDRQRMSEEKRCLAVKHEAEVTSLKLQLERTKAELNHYMSEANRLSQQLRMKNQQEEEQYKKHLESKGYLTRSASGRLPPMDPFVELDDEKDRLILRATSSPSPRLLTRGVDYLQANSGSTTTTSDSNSGSHSTFDVDRSRSPVKAAEFNAGRYGSTSSSNDVLPNPPKNSSPYHNGGSYYGSTHTPSSNGRSISPTPARVSRIDDHHYPNYGLSNGSSYSNRPLTNGMSQKAVAMTNGVSGNHYGDYNGGPYPPLPEFRKYN